MKVNEKIHSINTKTEVIEYTREGTPEDEFEPTNEYEKALRHLEAEIRNHIRVLH